MAGIYYTDMLDVLVAAGCRVAENSTTNGWQTWARSSGGFPSPPLGVWWHHTASSTSPANDLSWMIDGSDDAPIGNLLIDRDGRCWPIAAGASNCAGKGGPVTFSRGVCPTDSGNTRGWQIEVANGGTGEAWPVAQVDAFFAASNALNAHVGNQPDDIVTHNAYAPSRKIDPATADAVEGRWQPRSSTSSGTWHLGDIRDECTRRAGTLPPPEPSEEDDVPRYLILDPNDGRTQFVSDLATYKTPVSDSDVAAEGVELFGWTPARKGTADPFILGDDWADYIRRLPVTS